LESLLVDPTQFIFTGEKPHISIINSVDDRYDEAGHRLRASLGFTAVPAREGEPKHVLDLSPVALEYVRTHYFPDRDLSSFTMREVHFLAHLDPDACSVLADIHKALTSADLHAFIPQELQERVSGETKRALVF
jgi:hypothetical protein